MQANLPRFNYPYPPVTQDSLNVIINDLSNGANYRISGGELQLKNTDTGLYNPVSSVGADGGQSVQLENGEA